MTTYINQTSSITNPFFVPSEPTPPKLLPFRRAGIYPTPLQKQGNRQTTTVCLSTGYNVQVIVEDNDPEEKLLRMFRREVMRAGIIQVCKRRSFFQNTQEQKTREAAWRNRKRPPGAAFKNKEDAPSSKRTMMMEITRRCLKETFRINSALSHVLDLNFNIERYSIIQVAKMNLAHNFNEIIAMLIFFSK